MRKRINYIYVYKEKRKRCSFERTNTTQVSPKVTFVLFSLIWYTTASYPIINQTYYPPF